MPLHVHPILRANEDAIKSANLSPNIPDSVGVTLSVNAVAAGGSGSYRAYPQAYTYWYDAGQNAAPYVAKQHS
jgi:hypothetical protein